MNRLRELLGNDFPVLFDGAMGTLMQERGLKDGGSGELWNVELPDAVRGIHDDYAKAGAQFITTNTFGGTEPRLAMHGLGDRVVELNQAAATLAREVARRHGAFVAGGLGPTGELMSPMGTLDEAAAAALFEQQLEGLLAGGIDVIIVETISDITEAKAAITAAETVAPSLPWLVTMSFDTNLHTMMGISPEEAVRRLSDTSADAVGANCGRGLGEMEAIMAKMVQARSDEGRTDDVLLISQSNAGLPHLVGDRFVYDASADDVVAHALRLRELGVEIIGACCGSTPEYVAAIKSGLAHN